MAHRNNWVKSIPEQVEKLMEYFPGLNPEIRDYEGLAIPDCADGLFAIPRWQSLFGNSGEQSEDKYRDAVGAVFNALQFDRKCLVSDHCLFDDILGWHIYPREHPERAWDWIAKQQNQDILLVPASIYYDTYSKQSLPKFFLGLFSVGIILLTHPETFNATEKIKLKSVECAGDRIVHHHRGGGSVSSGVPLLSFYLRSETPVSPERTKISYSISTSEDYQYTATGFYLPDYPRSNG